MVVGAIGIGVEMLMAAVAVFVFAHATIGMVHAVAYNVILIGGVSTLLFNGNPLLRFDGYYVLADALELPNLGQRANRYLGYLIERYAFGSRDASFPETDRRARAWFVFFGIASFVYRLFISLAIIISAGITLFHHRGAPFDMGRCQPVDHSHWQGLFVSVVEPSSAAKPAPRRRIHRIGCRLRGPVLVRHAVPTAHGGRGITWPSERSQIRAGTDGFIGRLLVANGSQVEPRQPLIEAYDPFLDARVEVLEAQLRGLRRQYTAVRATDQAEAAVLQEEINGVVSDLERARERRRELVITSPRAGVFVAPVEQDMPGRFVKKGQLVGFVIDASDRLTARTMVGQNDIALVRERTRGVDVIPVHWEGRSSRTSIIREVPEGLKALPDAGHRHDGRGQHPDRPARQQRRYGARSLLRIRGCTSGRRRPSLHRPAGPGSLRPWHRADWIPSLPLIPPDLSEALRCLKRRCCDLASPWAHIPSVRTCGRTGWTAPPAPCSVPSTQRFGPNHLDRGFLRQVASASEGLELLTTHKLSEMASVLRRDLHRDGLRPDLVASAFAMIREVSGRTLGMRHFDVQLLGGWAMMRGKVAEMETGEGKTLAATLPAATAALAGIPVHIITVNDFLVVRDAAWMKPLYDVLGLSVGTILEGMSTTDRRHAYGCSITYCTNKQVVFDYLKDRLLLQQENRALHLKIEALHRADPRVSRLMMRGLCFAVVDEADSVLVDEARTPLIISGGRGPATRNVSTAKRWTLPDACWLDVITL